MRNFLTILFALLMTFNAHAATTTTNKVQSPSGNLTLDTPSSASNVVIPSNILATDPSKTHSFSGVQINNAQIGSAGTDNLTLRAGATGTTTILMNGNPAFPRVLSHYVTDDSTTTGSNASLASMPVTPYTRFTNASLVSIDMIPAPASGTAARELTFFNGLTTDIVFNLETGATAANRVIAPTGTKFTLKDGLSVSMVYNATKSRWVIKGFDGIANTSVVGPWTTGICTSSHTTAVTTTCKYRQVGDSIEINFKNTYSGLTNAVNLTFGLPNGWTVDTSKLQGPAANFTPYLSTVSFLDSGVTLHPGYATYWDASNIQIRYFNNAAAATAVKSDNAVTNVLPATTSSGDTVDALVVVPITQFAASTNTLSSTNGNTSWASCGHTTSDFTGFGTVTNIETQCKRDGDDLLMRGKFTSGTSTAVEARLNLKHQGVPVTIAGAGKIQSIQIASEMERNISSTIFFGLSVLMEPSVGYVTFGAQTSTLNKTVKQNGSTLAATGDVLNIVNARIPIAGWENSNVIVASLSGLEKCANSFECEDRFTAYVTSAGVVSAENLDWISGNVSVGAASTYTYTLNINTANLALTSGMVCTYTADNVGRGVRYLSVSPSVITQTVFNTNTQVAVNDTGFSISCTKTGADYIGKTAKAVASDQNVKTPGGLNVDLISFSYGGNAGLSVNCTVAGACNIDNIGSGVSSYVRSASAGQYTINLLKTYSKVKCTGSFANAGVGPAVSFGLSSCSGTCSSVSVATTIFSGSTQPYGDTAGTWNCVAIP